MKTAKLTYRARFCPDNYDQGFDAQVGSLKTCQRALRQYADGTGLAWVAKNEAGEITSGDDMVSIRVGSWGEEGAGSGSIIPARNR